MRRKLKAIDFAFGDFDAPCYYCGKVGTWWPNTWRKRRGGWEVRVRCECGKRFTVRAVFKSGP